MPFNRSMAFGVAAIVLLPVVPAQAEESSSRGLVNETKPSEIRIVSTEFKYAPSKVRIAVGRTATLVLDNSGAETEHGLYVPAFGFRLQAKAGEIARNTFIFDKPGQYDFICDLPGHREAGMKGTLTITAF
ncbi:MAG: cupredoxin domain-containing protein [Verrucomicrobia subdivision 3 bacterium]|nr:cupredoxin domain-containing protein [Limisphaerales bacterium]